MTWISVKDRLPEDGDFVLIYIAGLVDIPKHERIETSYFSMNYNGNLEYKYFFSVSQSTGMIRFTSNQNMVTHWCIPDPPGEGG